MAAELDARPAFCLGTTEAGTCKIIGAVLDVRAKLLLHVILDVGTMEKLRGKRTKVGHEFHTSSG
jgi:hypothetical protein